MNEYREVYDNLAFLLGTFGDMAGTRYSGGEGGVAFYDSGVPDAYENYALLEPARPVSEETVSRGLEFFARSGNAHIWPIFPGAADEARKILEDRGLARNEDFHAMIAETSKIDRNDADMNLAEAVRGDDEAGKWAGCVWRGFGSDGRPPESFVSNARSMARMDAFTLVHVGLKATGMLYASGETCGIYYVATSREFRGRGLAGAVIEGLKARARRLGFGRVVLLSTPSGLGLYLKHGFKDVGTVKIYRMDYNNDGAIVTAKK